MTSALTDRGSTYAGRQHVNHWRTRIDNAGGWPCWRCRAPILPDQPFKLGHLHDRTGGDPTRAGVRAVYRPVGVLVAQVAHDPSAPVEQAIIEPHDGGRCYDRCVDGSECDWGTVLTYAPPSRLVLAWQVTGDWQYEPDLHYSSRVTVSFTPDGDGTRVELVHDQFERHRDGGSRARPGVQNGWAAALESFAGAAAAAQGRPTPRVAPREYVLAVLRYAVVAEQAGRLPEVYPRQRAYLDAFADSGDLLMLGTLEDPVTNGSEGVFHSKAAAERFVGRDPFVLEGLVVPTVLEWNVLDFTTAGR